MRVITGSAKGKRLESPKGDDVVRPTTDRVKEALFSILQFELENAAVLDLFAGSGQLGIEALSRGAQSCVFVEKDPTVAKLVERNIAACNFQNSAKVIKGDFKAVLNGTKSNFDIAFLDPPYSAGLFDEALKLTAAHMSDRGIMVCEHPKDTDVFSPEGFSRKDYKYGRILISVFRKEVL